MKTFKQFQERTPNYGQMGDLSSPEKMVNWIRDYIQKYPGCTVEKIIKAGSPHPYKKTNIISAIKSLTKDKFILPKGKKLFWEEVVTEATLKPTNIYQVSKGGEVVIGTKRGGKIQGGGSGTARIRFPDGSVQFVPREYLLDDIKEK